jgi:hypothetical protein
VDLDWFGLLEHLATDWAGTPLLLLLVWRYGGWRSFSGAYRRDVGKYRKPIEGPGVLDLGRRGSFTDVRCINTHSWRSQPAVVMVG